MLRQGSLLYGGHFSSKITNFSSAGESFLYIEKWSPVSILRGSLFFFTPCARIDRRRPATYRIMSRKRREHGDVVVTYNPMTIVINLEIHLAIFANSPRCHKFASSSSSWKSHEPATKLNFISDRRRVTLTVSPAQLDSPGFLQNQKCF